MRGKVPRVTGTSQSDPKNQSATCLLSGRIAEGEEPTVVVPPAVPPVEAEASLRIVPPQARHAAKTVHHIGGAKSDDGELSLGLGEGCSVGKQFLDGFRTEAHRVEFGNCLVRCDGSVEVNELGHDIVLALPRVGEVLGCDVLVRPVVVTCLHHVGKRHAVVDGDAGFERGETTKLPKVVTVHFTHIRIEEIGEKSGLIELLKLFRWDSFLIDEGEEVICLSKSSFFHGVLH